MSIYEVHAGSWRQGLGYRELADELVPYVKQMGFTHVEFMPLAEHPFGGSWGYQVTSYYAPTSRYGTPDDFRSLVDAFHRAGIGVILDWVPAHFPKDDFALARFDGTPLYEDPDPLRGEHPDWGTYVFNFGRREVRNFLVANALYWLQEFHADGLRVDAVASMLYLDYSRQDGQWHPNQFGGRENLEAISFLQEATATAYRKNPGIVMAAEDKASDNYVMAFGAKARMEQFQKALTETYEEVLAMKNADDLPEYLGLIGKYPSDVPDDDRQILVIPTYPDKWAAGEYDKRPLAWRGIIYRVIDGSKVLVVTLLSRPTLGERSTELSSSREF